MKRVRFEDKRKPVAAKNKQPKRKSGFVYKERPEQRRARVIQRMRPFEFASTPARLKLRDVIIDAMEERPGVALGLITNWGTLTLLIEPHVAGDLGGELIEVALAELEEAQQ